MGMGQKKKALMAVYCAVILAGSSLWVEAGDLMDLSGSVGWTGEYQVNVLNPLQDRFSLRGNYSLGLSGVLGNYRIGTYHLGGTYTSYHYDSGGERGNYPLLQGYDLLVDLFPQGKLKLAFGTHQDAVGRAVDPRASEIGTSFTRLTTTLPFQVGLNYLYSSSRVVTRTPRPDDPLRLNLTGDTTTRQHTVDLYRFFSFRDATLDTNGEVVYQETVNHLQGGAFRGGYRGSFQSRLHLLHRPLFLSLVETTWSYFDPRLETSDPYQPGYHAGLQSRWDFSQNLWFEETVSFDEVAHRWRSTADLGFRAEPGRSFRLSGHTYYTWTREKGKEDLRQWDVLVSGTCVRWQEVPLNLGTQIRDGFDATRQVGTRTYAASVGTSLHKAGFTVTPAYQWRQVQETDGEVLSTTNLGNIGLGYAQQLGPTWLTASTGVVVDQQGWRPQPNYYVGWRYEPGEKIQCQLNYTGKIPGAGEPAEQAEQATGTEQPGTTPAARPSVGLTFRYQPWYNLRLEAAYTVFEPGAVEPAYGTTAPQVRQFTGKLSYGRRNLSLELGVDHREYEDETYASAAHLTGTYLFRAVSVNLTSRWTTPGVLATSLSITRTF